MPAKQDNACQNIIAMQPCDHGTLKRKVCYIFILQYESKIKAAARIMM
jgi:hypothetical protein